MTAKLAKVFSINLLSGRTKVLIKSTQSFSEVQALLGEGTAHTARKNVLAFVWLDRKTQARTRVEDELGYQKFITEKRLHLLADLSAEDTEKLRTGEEQDRQGTLSETEEGDLRKLLTVDQEVICVGAETDDKTDAESEYDPEKLRAERLRRQAEAEERVRGTMRAKDPGETVKFITLRFPQENKDLKGHGTEITGLPYTTTWEELCQALTAKFKRTVHIRYHREQKMWKDIRSPEAWARFRQEMGADWAAQGAVTGSAEVQLLPFGTGVLPMLESIEDVLVLGLTHDVIKAKMVLMPLLHKCATDQVGAAEQARVLVQAAKSTVHEEKDDMARTVLHLASMQGYSLLVEAILSAPSDVRSEMLKARDLKGRTPLHYARNEAVAKALLQAKADPRVVDDIGQTPLHTVSDADIAPLLLKGKKFGGLADALVNAKDKFGMSPLLIHASHTGAGKMLSCLVDQVNGIVNSDEQAVQVDLKAEDNFGRTALHHAAAGNHHASIQTLVRSGQVDINARDHYGMTPLHVAARGEHIRTVSFLVGQRADVKIRDSSGRTALDMTQSKGIKRLLDNSSQSQRLRSAEA